MSINIPLYLVIYCMSIGIIGILSTDPNRVAALNGCDVTRKMWRVILYVHQLVFLDNNSHRNMLKADSVRSTHCATPYQPVTLVANYYLSAKPRIENWKSQIEYCSMWSTMHCTSISWEWVSHILLLMWYCD